MLKEPSVWGWINFVEFLLSSPRHDHRMNGEGSATRSPAKVRARTVGPLYWLWLWVIDLVSLGWFALRTMLPFAARPDIRILVYHDIVDLVPEEDPLRISTPIALFEQQMRFLRHGGYCFLSVAEAAERLSSRDIPPRAVVVTFDDGHASFLETAAPILKRYEIPATLFVAVGCLGQTRLPWVPEKSHFSPPLQWEQLAALSSSYAVEIGSHTMTHRALHALSAAEQVMEIAASRRSLEERLKRPVHVFAYPFGGWDTFPSPLHDLLRRQGYRAACTNVMGANRARANPMALRRVRIGWCDTLWRFRLKLAGAYDWSDGLRRLVTCDRSGLDESAVMGKVRCT